MLAWRKAIKKAINNNQLRNAIKKEAKELDWSEENLMRAIEKHEREKIKRILL